MIKESKIKEYYNHLRNIEEVIDELVELGVNYQIFMNAKISHKKLKEIQKALTYVG